MACSSCGMSLPVSILELRFLCSPGTERGWAGGRRGLQTRSRNECARQREEEGTGLKPPSPQSSPSSHTPCCVVRQACGCFVGYCFGAKDGTQDLASSRQMLHTPNHAPAPALLMLTHHSPILQIRQVGEEVRVSKVP